jgi:hypothetical protein
MHTLLSTGGQSEAAANDPVTPFVLEQDSAGWSETDEEDEVDEGGGPKLKKVLHALPSRDTQLGSQPPQYVFALVPCDLLSYYWPGRLAKVSSSLSV